jgi:membrane protein implicated in regulation of membrane protease activity
MRKKLKAFLWADDTRGMKIAAAGFFIAIPGGVMVFAGYSIGGWIVDLGIFLGFVGVALHFIKNWRQIFRGDQ